MLINFEEHNTTPNKGAIKFVNYSGRYPNLCSGILTLEIEGKRYNFGHKSKTPTPDFNKFWRSSGCSTIYNRQEIVKKGEWLIDVNLIPEEFQKYAREIDEVFNKRVLHGCCGGCI